MVSKPSLSTHVSGHRLLPGIRWSLWTQTFPRRPPVSVDTDSSQASTRVCGHRLLPGIHRSLWTQTLPSCLLFTSRHSFFSGIPSHISILNFILQDFEVFIMKILHIIGEIQSKFGLLLWMMLFPWSHSLVCCHRYIERLQFLCVDFVSWHFTESVYPF